MEDFFDILFYSPSFLFPGLRREFSRGKTALRYTHIQISGLRSKKGTLRIGLFNSKETFSKKGKAIRSAVVKPNSREAETSFKELPYGYYAISLYHDENDNDKYNLGLVLFSRERYGFSNNVKPGLRGPPSFEAAMFLMNSNEQVVTIKLH